MEDDPAPETAPDVWKPRMLPPYWVVLGVIVLVAINALGPAWNLPQVVGRVGGAALILLGLGLALWGELQFVRAGTNAIPGRPVTALVRSGPYRWTRNPMYVGMTAALTGAALLLGSVMGLVVPAVFVVIIRHRFIRSEEMMLRAAVGEEQWERYAASVPRWLL